MELNLAYHFRLPSLLKPKVLEVLNRILYYILTLLFTLEYIGGFTWQEKEDFYKIFK